MEQACDWCGVIYDDEESDAYDYYAYCSEECQDEAEEDLNDE